MLFSVLNRLLLIYCRICIFVKSVMMLVLIAFVSASRMGDIKSDGDALR